VEAEVESRYAFRGERRNVDILTRCVVFMQIRENGSVEG
jgi:hypothetical protein